MSRLRPIPFRKVRRALERLGFKVSRQSGSHVVFVHADGRRAIVPRHDREDLGRGLLRTMLRQAEIDVEAFLQEV